MLDLFGSIFSAETGETVLVRSFLLCVGAALVTGLMYFGAYSFKNRASGSFRTALIMLPAVVSVVIMMVNGNIGVGVATAGAFSLVRFRSAQGSAKEISMIFMAMCSGLISGVGYIAYAVLFTVIMCAIVMVCNYASAHKKKNDRTRTLKMTVPEDLDYSGAFDGIFGSYTDSCEAVSVKTTNMGSLFKLTYRVTMKAGASEKEFIDSLRVRNGNLEISLLKEEEKDEL